MDIILEKTAASGTLRAINILFVTIVTIIFFIFFSVEDVYAAEYLSYPDASGTSEQESEAPKGPGDGVTFDWDGPPDVIYSPDIVYSHGPGDELADLENGTAESESDQSASGDETAGSGTEVADGAATGESEDSSQEEEVAAPDSTADQDTELDYDTQALNNSLTLKNTPVPSSQANIVFINGRQIDINCPIIALTYDDGPLDSVGNQIMDIMAAYSAKCTFFLVGDRVADYITEVQRMAAEGHEIANHTYSHTYLNRVSAQEIINQVTACNTIIEQVTGAYPTLMRLPGGNKNSTVLSHVNMPIILWNIDTRDWKTRNTQSTIDAVLGKVKSGDIVLMHELYQSTAEATAVIVPTLISQGFQLVTVSELAALRGVPLTPNTVYYSM